MRFNRSLLIAAVSIAPAGSAFAQYAEPPQDTIDSPSGVVEMNTDTAMPPTSDNLDEYNQPNADNSYHADTAMEQQYEIDRANSLADQAATDADTAIGLATIPR